MKHKFMRQQSRAEDRILYFGRNSFWRSGVPPSDRNTTHVARSERLEGRWREINTVPGTSWARVNNGGVNDFAAICK